MKHIYEAKAKSGPVQGAVLFHNYEEYLDCINLEATYNINYVAGDKRELFVAANVVKHSDVKKWFKDFENLSEKESALAYYFMRYQLYSMWAVENIEDIVIYKGTCSHYLYEKVVMKEVPKKFRAYIKMDLLEKDFMPSTSHTQFFYKNQSYVLIR